MGWEGSWVWFRCGFHWRRFSGSISPFSAITENPVERWVSGTIPGVAPGGTIFTRIPVSAGKRTSSRFGKFGKVRGGPPRPYERIFHGRPDPGGRHPAAGEPAPIPAGQGERGISLREREGRRAQRGTGG